MNTKFYFLTIIISILSVSCGSENSDDTNPTPTSGQINENVPDLIWSNSVATASPVSSGSVTIDNQANVYVAGDYSGNPNFDPLRQVTVGLCNGFFIKSDQSGNPLVIQDLGFTVANRLNYITIGDNGSVYVAGTYIPDANKVFFFELDGLGGQVGTTIISGSSGNDVPGGLDVDNAGNIVLAGTYRGTITYNNGDIYGSSILGSSSAVKIDQNGQVEWSYISPIQGVTAARDVAIDPNGNVYIHECAENLSYLRKLSPDGEQLWEAQTGRCGMGLKAVSEEEIYLGQEAGITRLNGSGEIVWQLASSANIISLDANTSGQIVVAGRYFSEGVFGDIDLPEPSDISSYFIARVNNNGSVAWISDELPATGVAINSQGQVAYVNVTDSEIGFGLINSN